MFYTKWLLNNWQAFWGKLKRAIFGWVLQHIFCFFLFFSISAWKTLKMNISTSFWSVQHPNAGQNIQHELNLLPSSFLFSPYSNECLIPLFCLFCLSLSSSWFIQVNRGSKPSTPSLIHAGFSLVVPKKVKARKSFFF